MFKYRTVSEDIFNLSLEFYGLFSNVSHYGIVQRLCYLFYNVLYYITN